MDKTQHMLGYVWEYHSVHPIHWQSFMVVIYVADLDIYRNTGEGMGLSWVKKPCGLYSDRVAEFLGVTGEQA